MLDLINEQLNIDLLYIEAYLNSLKQDDFGIEKRYVELVMKRIQTYQELKELCKGDSSES